MQDAAKRDERGILREKAVSEDMAACRLHEKPNAQVNRQKCEAFLSVLNLQLGW